MNRLPQIAARRSRRIVLLLTIGTALLLLLLFLVGGVWVRSQAELALDRRLPDEALGWLAWLFIHLLYLVQFENRVLVLWQWAWNYLTRNRSARLITGPGGIDAARH